MYVSPRGSTPQRNGVKTLQKPLGRLSAVKRPKPGSTNQGRIAVMNQGWECPKCGSCYAPHVDECKKCPSTFTTPYVPAVCLHPEAVQDTSGTRCARCGMYLWP